MINYFSASIVVAPSLYMMRDNFALYSVLIVVFIESCIFLYRAHAKHLEVPSVVTKKRPADRSSILLVVSAIAIHLACLLLAAILTRSVNDHIARNVIYASLLLETLIVAHWGESAMRAAFLKSADNAVELDPLVDILCILEILPKFLQRILSSILFLFLPMFFFAANVSFVPDSVGGGLIQTVVILVALNVFYVFLLIMAVCINTWSS